jgi:imidazole glycerol-phosphate synthase subunit HisH
VSDRSLRVAVLDYCAGNLTSVVKALRAAGADAVVVADATGDAAPLAAADAIVIPGVGHFAATQAISADCRQTILRRVEERIPLLGICLGMQFLFDGSDEAPDAPGLGLIRGHCARLPPTVKVPHVGWNDLAIRPSCLLDGVANGMQAYFTHSYAAPVTSETIATTEHGVAFAAAVERPNVYGVQFHPEKSSAAGLQILRSFLALARAGALTHGSDRCFPSA